MAAREIIRVEPLSTYLERWKAPTSAVTWAGDTVYVSGFPRSIRIPARSLTSPSSARPSWSWSR
jgi:enamine deaminase RidA (YjgF/YER057c/UK114 family)